MTVEPATCCFRSGRWCGSCGSHFAALFSGVQIRRRHQKVGVFAREGAKLIFFRRYPAVSHGTIQRWGPGGQWWKIELLFWDFFQRRMRLVVLIVTVGVSMWDWYNNHGPCLSCSWNMGWSVNKFIVFSTDKKWRVKNIRA